MQPEWVAASPSLNQQLYKDQDTIFDLVTLLPDIFHTKRGNLA